MTRISSNDNTNDMSNENLRANQLAFHFYTKLFYVVNQARATEDLASGQKVDKWFNIETPTSNLFTKKEREPYRTISHAPFPGPPTLEIEVLLSIPESINNQVLVYITPDSSRVRIEPTPKFILLETWSLGITFHRPGSASDQLKDTSPDLDLMLPIIYRNGITLFRNVYSLLRLLPAWKFYQHLKRKINGFNRKGILGIKLRVRTQGESETNMHILGFNTRLSPTYQTPLPTSRHDFQAVPHLFGSFTLSTSYLTTPNFQLDELESILSLQFLSRDLASFVPTLDKNRQDDSVSSSSLPNDVTSEIESILSWKSSKAVGRVSSGNDGAGTDDSDIADMFDLHAPTTTTTPGAISLGTTASSGLSSFVPQPRSIQFLNPPITTIGALLSLGTSASFGTSVSSGTTGAIKPQPRVIHSLNPPNPSPLMTTIITSPSSIPSHSIPASGPHAVDHLPNETLNSSFSSNHKPHTPLPTIRDADSDNPDIDSKLSSPGPGSVSSDEDADLEKEISETASTSGAATEYSDASSRTKSTDYGLYYRRRALSQESVSENVLDISGPLSH